MFFERRLRLRRPVTTPCACQVEVLEVRQCLAAVANDTTLKTTTTDIISGFTATLTGTQKHDQKNELPKSDPLWNSAFWYGQPGGQTDGTFGTLPYGFKSFVKVWSNKRDVCNTLDEVNYGGDRDGGELTVKVGGLTPLMPYTLNVVLNTYGSVVGPSTQAFWKGKPLNVGTMNMKPAGSDANGVLSVPHSNQNTDIDVAGKNWSETNTWNFNVTNPGAGDLKVFHWTPTLSQARLNLGATEAVEWLKNGIDRTSQLTVELYVFISLAPVPAAAPLMPSTVASEFSDATSIAATSDLSDSDLDPVGATVEPTTETTSSDTSLSGCSVCLEDDETIPTPIAVIESTDPFSDVIVAAPSVETTIEAVSVVPVVSNTDVSEVASMECVTTDASVAENSLTSLTLLGDDVLLDSLYSDPTLFYGMPV